MTEQRDTEREVERRTDRETETEREREGEGMSFIAVLKLYVQPVILLTKNKNLL